MSKAIQDNNLLYNILCPLVKFGTRCHYNHFVIRGMENLPKDGAYIIAPCHQQALMEPLAVLRFAPKPPVFLARADIFARPTLRAILTFLRIMPVYRIRDGKSNLGRNQAIFDNSRDVLLDGYPLCLMAEGRHNNRHHLLPMGKGMFRIAGETQDLLGDHPLYIVPTGIDFDDYEKPYSNVVVNIGQPIPVQPFMDSYHDDEPVALNQMRVSLSEALMPLMHDIRDEEHYDEIYALCNILNREERHRRGLKNTAWNRFCMRQQISSEFDIQNPELMSGKAISATQTLKSKLTKLHLDEKTFSEHWSMGGTLMALLLLAAAVTSVVMLPVVRWLFIFCLICYPLPFIPTHLLVRKKIADPQFRSSFNFGIRFFLSIVYAIIVGIVMTCGLGQWLQFHLSPFTFLLPPLLWGLAAVVWVHVGARMAAPTVNFLRATVTNCHYWFLQLTGRLREANSLFKTLSDAYKPRKEVRE